MRMLLSYSDQFSKALALWPIASLVLTLPILAFLYHRDGRLRLWAAVGSYLAVFYALGLVCFTLYPLPDGPTGLGFTYGVRPQTNFWRFVSDLRYGGRAAVFQLAANVVLFVPLGFFAARGLGWGPVRCTLAGFAVSALIETTQLTGLWGIYPYSYRTFDVDDLLTNTCGAFIGWACAAVFSHFVPHRIEPEALEPTRTPNIVRRTVAFAIDAALIWGFSTIVYVFGQYALRHGLLGVPHAVRAAELAVRYSAWIMIALFEWLVPLARGGRTLGGSFVRMTCETKERRGLLRLAFMTLRAAVIVLVVRRPVEAGLVLLVFWLVARQMPYDLLPASTAASGSRA